MNTVEKIIVAFADEKRLHKMVDIAYDPQIRVRGMFDAGNISTDGKPLEEFASMSLTFFVGKEMYIVEVERDLEGFEYGTLKEFSGSKGNWQFEGEADLPDEVAESLCKFGDVCVSQEENMLKDGVRYIVREHTDRDVYTADSLDSDEYLEREYWDKENSQYRSRLADEVEYRDPRYYTNREDDGSYGRYDSYYGELLRGSLAF